MQFPASRCRSTPTCRPAPSTTRPRSFAAASWRRRSSFFGSMDGASKFVRGDAAIAGLIITFINIVGGITIGYFRHGMGMAEASDVFIKLSVGDGLVTQIPAAYRLAGRRPSGVQGRHARLRRQGGVRPARRLSARALRRGAAAAPSITDAGPADALRRVGRRDGSDRLYHPAAPQPRTGREGSREEAGGGQEGRGGEKLGQGLARRRDRASHR